MNAVLAPVLIAGWGTGRPLGVMGAGLASTIAVLAAVVMMLVYFLRLEHFVGFDAKQLKFHLGAWKRILKVGLPAGGEFALMFVFMGVVYAIIRDVGASAQAGFGIGGRVMQSLFLPAMAVAFAAICGSISPLHNGQWPPQPAPEPVARTSAPHRITTTL